MNKTFFTRNREALYKNLPDGALLVVFSGGSSHRTADEDFRFFGNRNFVYLTGIDEPDCVLFTRRVSGELRESLFIRDPDPDVERWTGRRITVSEAVEASGISDVKMRSTFDSVFHKVSNDTYFSDIFLCLEANRGQERTDQNHLFHQTVLGKYSNLRVNNIFNKIAALRMIKSADELAAIDRAVAITREGILSMLAACKSAEFEMDLFAEFMYVIHKHGAVEPAFKPIISCGDNNFYLHYDTPTGKLKDDALCLVDVGAKVDFCNVDISRVFPRNGVFNERQKLVYNIALDVNNEVTETIKPGMSFKDINDMNRNLTFSRLKATGLLDDIKDLDNYVWHGCSHHIGFDVHDVGTYELPIAEGMFFSMDMGIYIQKWGIGMRIEDDVLVTSDGLKNVSSSIPRTIEEIEAAMC
ncbi:MAG: Xaa-Pro peptidase family protein [Oscillospiraceae bacterium]|nr:Xaa-Pro peptidase family protein [Oscillospiraceae bacterium]